MLPNGKQRLFFSCFTVSSTSCRTGFTCFSTLSVRLLKLYSCFPTLSIGFIKSLQIIIFARKNTQPCHTVRRVSDLKSAQHKKSSSAATWIFCMEPIRFGIIKGEQPLIRNGDDRGQRPKQGGAVGAAACRMRVPPKARSRRRVPQPVGSSASKSLRPCRAEHAAFASQTGLRLKSPTGAFMPCGHRRPFWFSFGTQKRTYPVEKNCIKVKKSVPLEYALYGKHCSKKRTPKNP